MYALGGVRKEPGKEKKNHILDFDFSSDFETGISAMACDGVRYPGSWPWRRNRGR